MEKEVRMPLWSTFGIAVLTIWVYMSAMFLVALRMGRNDIADIIWGPGFFVVGLVSLLTNEGVTLRQLLVLALVGLWALRLAVHVGRRNLNKPEDHRYQQMREDWGDAFVWRSYLQVFMLQGLFMFLVSLPIQIVMTTDPGRLDVLTFLGLVLWIIGFVFEAVGDYQLDRFKSDPANKGKIMTEGLWRYTRHPNYFGEVTQWWAIAIICLTVPWGWLGIIGAVTITLLILGVSGIPMLERHFEGRPGWESYKERTSPFFPWPPKDS
jgi:steroid 5-alpha reductase family enzyme